jgi:vitamin B12 transporter
MLTAGLERNFGRGFSAGAGVVYVAKRQDVDPLTFATIDAADYAVTRLYAAWAVNDRVTVKLRVENLFDEHYEEVSGYPARGAGAFAGFAARF